MGPQVNPMIEELLGPEVGRRTWELHKWLKLRLLASRSPEEGARLLDGVKDAAVDFLSERGHTPDAMGSLFDGTAQMILECVFMQNIALMGPDGTGDSDTAEANKPVSSPPLVEKEAWPHVELAGQQRRRRIWKHIAEVFADLPIGTELRAAEIAARTSKEYGNDHPSMSAIRAWLGGMSFAKLSEKVPGVVPCKVDDIYLGARKVHVWKDA